MYRKFFKRFLDLVFSGAFIFFFSWLFLVIALMVRLSSSGPIIFRGKRTGFRGVPFEIYKFRTMVVGSEKGAGTTSKNDPRITNLGYFLRKYKLDELPQFFNVFCGQMSLVGPRPELPRYTDEYNNEELIILKVKPGITDWASVHLASMGDKIDDADPDASFEQKFLPIKNRLRVKYASNVTFIGDVTILALTVLAILKK